MYEDNLVRNRINNIFDGHLLTDESEAFNVISGICTVNSSNTRRIVENEIEKRDMLVKKTILQEFNKVKQKFNLILNSITTLDSSVKSMSNKLQESKRKTSHLIIQTTKLKDEKKKTEKKLNWVNSFITTFPTPSHNKEIVHSLSSTVPVTLEFFDTTIQLEKIIENCKILVKCWYQTSAFDIMEYFGMQHEIALEKLYHYLITVSRNIDSPNNPIIPKALTKFENRRVLFNNILDEYCTARKVIIVQQFIDALTKGTNGSKPIEFFATDVKRYIGDIMSWVYQIIPVEKENLLNILKYCDSTTQEQQATESLSSIVEALSPLLKVRAELILKPDKNPLVLWSITNLITYYKGVIESTMIKGHIIDTFCDLQNKSQEVFLLTLDSKIQKDLSHGVKAPPSDLNPSLVVTDLVSFLRDLLADTNVSSINEVDIKILINHIVEPLLHAINETACHLSSTDMSVYTLNCIYHIQCTLSLYTMMNEYNERLQAQSEAQIDTLTSEQASFLVANLNLGPIYTILQEKMAGPLSAVPGMDTLSSFLNSFDIFLNTPEAYILSQLKLLLNHNHKPIIKRRAFEVILAVYTQLYTAVHNPSNGYVDPQLILRRTPEEVRKLLNM